MAPIILTPNGANSTTVPMANTKSAQKRTRQNIRRTARNKSVINAMKTAIKDARVVKNSSKSPDSKGAASAIKLALSRIMKAASKGIIHKKTASRYVSRLTKSN